MEQWIYLHFCLSSNSCNSLRVSDLTSKAFLASFKRFTNRRNLPWNIRSNQGTTFTETDKGIHKVLFSETSPEFQKIKEYTGNFDISWSYSPPYRPQFGGIRKAVVKSFKHHYRRILGEESLTFEEHSTLAAQIQACLNSRPLYAISTDGYEPIP